MKRDIKILIVVCLLGSGNLCFGQGDFGLKGGLNVANIVGDSEGVSSKTGFNAGIFISGELSDNVAMQFEVMYSQQGASAGGINVNYNYVNVPIIMKFFVSDEINIQVGPQLGVLASAKLGDFDVRDQVSDLDGAIALGFGYESSSNVIVDFRYNLGITDTASNDGDDTFPNGVFQFSLGFKLQN